MKHFLDVTVVTLPSDNGYSDPLLAKVCFEFSGGARCERMRAICWRFGDLSYSKKRSGVGCGPLFSVLRKSGRLFDLDRSSSILSQIVERGFERLSLEAILIDLE
jgi:hypothetical protein